MEKDSDITVALTRLRQAKSSINVQVMDVEKLYALAKARHGLSVSADCIQKAVSKGVNNLNQHEGRLLEAAQNLCMDTDSRWPK